MRTMRTISIVLILILGSFFQVYAQDTVSGTVYLEDSETPAVGATVKVDGTDRGAITDIDGNFEIEASDGETIVVSFVGYATQTSVVSGDSLSFTLDEDTSLDAVVVTAMGIEKEKEALGYSYDEIGEKEIENSSEDNIVNVLQGNTTGALISRTGGGPGQTSRIVIRGINTFSNDNEPLFVVDGIPIDNSSLTVGGGSVRNISNRAADINPSEIESVTVLKGGAATAIYGSRASNGAIIITTKRGTPGTSTVRFTTSYGVESVNKFPETQRVYTQGFGGVYDPNSFWPTWGPTVEEAREIDPDHPATIFNNYENAYQTGEKYSADLSFSGGTEDARYYVSGGYLNHEGTIPFSDYQKISAKVTGDFQLNDRFKVGASVQFINSGGDRVNADSFNERLTYWAPATDVNDYIKEDGTMKGYRFGGDVGNNPIYGARTNKFVDNVNRFIPNLTLNYQLNDWLSANYRVGFDHYTDFRDAYAPGPTGIADENVFENNGLGYVIQTPIKSTNFNSNAYLKFEKTFSELTTSFLVGHELLDNKYDRVTTTGNELDIYNLYNLGNAKEITTSQYKEQRREVGVFGDLQFDYGGFLYLTLTGRNDWNSTLPLNDNSTFYPSASVSWVASENLNLPEAFSYLKIRSSYGEVGKSVSPYETETVYFPQSGFPFNNENGVAINGWTRSNSAGDPNLRPEIIKTFDVGTDMNFLQNRVGVDFTWYRSKSQDLIINVPVTTSSGFSTFSGNAGSIENKGVELQLRGTPILNDDWELDMAVNFTSNQGEVIDIRDDVESISIGSFFGYAGSTASMRFEPGFEYGNIFGRSWLREGDEGDLYVDTSKPLVIGDNGFPQRGGQKILGNSQPDWFGSINTDLRWKNFRLNALIDTRQGAQKYNQMGNFHSAFGIAPYTLNRNETIVFDGVLEDGSPNTQEVWLGQGVGPDGMNYGAGYYRNHYRAITENFVEDADWWRLRNVSLTYSFPENLIQGLAKSASIGIIGYNLWLDTDYSGFDPEGIATGNSVADGFTGFNYPGSESVTLRLQVTPF